MSNFREQFLGARALGIVDGIVDKSAAGHEPDEFLSRSPEYHEDKALRHLMTSRLMRRGDIPPDSEGADGHLHRAITRLVMAERRHQKEL